MWTLSLLGGTWKRLGPHLPALPTQCWVWLVSPCLFVVSTMDVLPCLLLASDLLLKLKIY